MPTCPKLVLTVLPQDGFIPYAEDNSTIRLPPPHEIAQPVASSGPYYPFPPVLRHILIQLLSPLQASRYLFETNLRILILAMNT
jgi:hypothetical protein